jgi:hypothetical protein
MGAVSRSRSPARQLLASPAATRTAPLTRGEPTAGRRRRAGQRLHHGKHPDSFPASTPFGTSGLEPVFVD